VAYDKICLVDRCPSVIVCGVTSQETNHCHKNVKLHRVIFPSAPDFHITSLHVFMFIMRSTCVAGRPHCRRHDSSCEQGHAPGIRL
jgi:hypothetical protein